MMRIIIITIFAVVITYIFFSHFSYHIRPTVKKTVSSIPNVSHAMIFPSNQWYTSVISTFPGNPVYALPIAYKVTKDGLGFLYPNINKTAHTIFATYDEDFHIGFANPLHKPQILSISDWSIQLLSQTAFNENLSFTLAHGMPFTNLTADGKKRSE